MDSINNNVPCRIDNIAGINIPIQKTSQKKEPAKQASIPGDEMIMKDAGITEQNILSPGRILEMKSGIQSAGQASEISSATAG